MKVKFYHCAHCGNVVMLVRDCGVPISCCGETLEPLEAGATDGAQEKHVPVYQVEGGQVAVSVGSAEHPMTPEHAIEWICLQTRQGCQFKTLDPSGPPRARFALCDGDAVEAVYAYCNLHGLWRA